MSVKAGAYIQWHADRLLAEEGEISHYLLVEDTLIIHGEPDSVDGYIGVFISLVSQFLQQGGVLEEATLEQVTTLSLDKLDALTREGLTRVRPGSKVYYYMDNVEVLAAYYALMEVVEDPEILGDLSNRIAAMEQGLQSLWDSQSQHYDIGLMENGQKIPAGDLKRLYPDGIAQVYNIAFEVYPMGLKHAGEQYERFSSLRAWEKLDYLKDNDFLWTERLFIAARMGDIQKAQVYLHHYQEFLDSSRLYPFHVGTAGWSLKAVAVMIEGFEGLRDSSLWEDFKRDRILETRSMERD
ncbi:MAG: hypothetical protein AVO33_11340 [delta proteobacterium ML8_F1]|nr:MAG: hypothetical protein AVO33_11340 [delta proteobacterium ML8_F1]